MIILPIRNEHLLQEESHHQAIRILEGLATATSSSERASVIQIGLVAFDHKDTTAHDRLVKNGAVNIIFELLRIRMEYDSKLDEVLELCQLVGLLYRCSDETLVTSINAIGAELIVLLFTILFDSQQSSTLLSSSSTCINNNDKPSPSSLPSPSPLPCAVIDLLKRIYPLNINIQKMTKFEYLLRSLRQIIEADNNDTNNAIQNIVVEALGVLVVLSRHIDSKRIVMESPGLFETVLSKIVSSSFQMGSNLNLQVAKLLHSLAWDVRNKSLMAKNKVCVGVLRQLSGDSNNDTSLEAIRTMKYLTQEAASRELLAHHGGTKLLDNLLKATYAPMLQEDATYTLLHLITRKTARKMVKHPNLLSRFRAIAQDYTKNNTNIVNAAALSAQAIKRLACSVFVNDKSHQAILEVMFALSTSECRRVKYWIAKAFAEQTMTPGTSFMLARTPKVLKVLSQLAKDDNPEVKAISVEALQRLAEHSTDARIISNDMELLEAFVYNIEFKGSTECEEITKARRFAVQGLLQLANSKSLKPRLAKRKGFVASLSRYGSSNDVEEELRKAALRSVIMLAPYI